jgi:N-acetylglutamate synthase
MAESGVIALVPFDTSHYDAAVALWRSTDGITLRPADDRPSLTIYLERNSGLSFVALADGVVVGTVLCGTDGRPGYLQHLAVAPDYRRHGIGKRLAEASLDALCSLGVTKCHLFVLQENSAAHAFWKRLGWQERDDIRMYSYGQG